MLKSFLSVLCYSSLFAIAACVISGGAHAQQDANSFYGNNNSNYSNNQNSQNNSSSLGNSSSPFNNQQSSQSSDNRRRSSRRSSRGSQDESLSGGNSTSRGNQRSAPRPSQAGGAPTGGGAGGGSSTISILGGASGGKEPSKQAAPGMVNVRPVNVLYLVSKSSMMNLGEPFTVDVKLSMPEADEFDSLAFQLRYDPDVLMPVQGRLEDGQWAAANAAQYLLPQQEQASGSSNDLPNALFSDAADAGRIVANQINPLLGEIQFQTSAQTFTKSGSYFVASFMFVPLRPSDESSIRFGFEPRGDGNAQLSTHLIVKGRDWLGSSENLMDGVVPLHFQVLDPNQDFARSNLITSSLDAAPLDESGKQPAQLLLHLEDNEIETGDTFNLIVTLLNPDQRSIDEINLFLLYNPNVMQAMDSRAVLASGAIESPVLPFDFTTHHEIDAGKGIIDLRKRSSRSAVRGGGVCAVIPFRAIKPTTKTTFRILIDGGGKAPTTGAFYKSRDALGDLMDPNDGCVTASVSIRPTAVYLQNVSGGRGRS
ncbi:MAG: hypothetical protein P9L94_04700 [Candidatus Hinthialibacter antarcticus]|nr:hypothetical protein [Candidatus Hinthialibacter antarcticus]